jgi:hypothetical protein
VKCAAVAEEVGGTARIQIPDIAMALSPPKDGTIGNPQSRDITAIRITNIGIPL